MGTGPYDTGCSPSMLDTERELADQHAGETRRVGDHAMDRGYTSIFREHLFAGKVVVITGGGSGIGRYTAHELASLGAVVALIGVAFIAVIARRRRVLHGRPVRIGIDIGIVERGSVQRARAAFGSRRRRRLLVDHIGADQLGRA